MSQVWWFKSLAPPLLYHFCKLNSSFSVRESSLVSRVPSLTLSCWMKRVNGCVFSSALLTHCYFFRKGSLTIRLELLAGGVKEEENELSLCSWVAGTCAQLMLTPCSSWSTCRDSIRATPGSSLGLQWCFQSLMPLRGEAGCKFLLFSTLDRELRARKSFWHTGGLGIPKYHRQDVWAPTEPCVLEQLGDVRAWPHKELGKDVQGFVSGRAEVGTGMKRKLCCCSGGGLGVLLTWNSKLPMPRGTRRTALDGWANISVGSENPRNPKSYSCLLRLLSIGSVWTGNTSQSAGNVHVRHPLCCCEEKTPKLT